MGDLLLAQYPLKGSGLLQMIKSSVLRAIDTI